jgi:hypothetical protein
VEERRETAARREERDGSEERGGTSFGERCASVRGGSPLRNPRSV